MTPDLRFPPGFRFGVATSAYQIEGSPLADGAGVSNWHRFAHTPGMTANDETGDVACDHYRRSDDDLDLLAGLSVGAYRFSIAWSRVLPEGRGPVNRAGLGFYDRLVDRLVARGIDPMVTLVHWDWPAALDDRGGWLNPDSANWFAEYARVVVRALGDRVGFWVTLNEPWVMSDGGYLFGALAPGRRSVAEAPRVSHNLLRAHGAGLQAIRAEGGRRAGLVVNFEPKYPASARAADVEASRLADAYMNRQYLDPVFLRRYPGEMAAIFGAAWPEVDPRDFDLIAQPLDFLGVNYYTRSVVAAGMSRPPLPWTPVKQQDRPHTATAWEIFPAGLTDSLRWVRDRYGAVPLYVTENGAALAEPPTVEGPLLDDPVRVAYLRSHLLAALGAIADGVDLRGYFAWSLLDNFEWSAGYAKRFGLYHVDFATQRRTPKASARFYAEVARTGSVAAAEPDPALSGA